jgi:hypothetical protein
VAIYFPCVLVRAVVINDDSTRRMTGSERIGLLRHFLEIGIGPTCLKLHWTVNVCFRRSTSCTRSTNALMRTSRVFFTSSSRKGFPSNWAGLGYWASRTARHLCGLNRPHCSCALRGETTALR